MTMPDNTNTAMLNSVKETIKSSSIWNKLVKTIENANINMDKLIQDSVSYGIEIGMFHQNKDGSIECKEAKRISKNQSNDKFISPLQQKNMRNEEITQINLRSAPKSDSETTLSAYSSSKSIGTRTRKTCIEKDLKRSSETVLDTASKRLKSDSQTNAYIQNHKAKPIEQKPVKIYKSKPINRKMVRPIPICAFCLGDEALNKRTKRQENMINCWDCGTCAHPTCLQWPDSLFQKVRTIRWQCLQCKRCSYCGMISRKDDDMLLCDACDQGFHIYCCDPPIKNLPKGEWVCRICRPTGGRKEKPSIFSPEDYDFEPDCQIITPENVRKLCNISPKPANINSSKSIKNKVKVKSKLKSIKVNLLHLKKKKLVNKAVQRQRQALTDGLSKFFTPSNKRQSRVSKQSISSDSLFDKDSKKSNSIISPPKEKGCSRSVVSSSRSKSPIIVDVADESLVSNDNPSSITDKKKKSHKKLPTISIYHSPKRINQDGENKLHSNFKSKLKKFNLKKISFPKKIIQKQSIITRGPGRPKKQLAVDKGMIALENSASITESSSITMSKNDLSTNYSVLSTDVCEPDSCPINEIDRQWYADIQQKVAELLPPPVDAAPQLLPTKQINTPNRNRNEHADPPELSIETHVPEDNSNFNNIDSSVNQRFPPRIQIGRHVIDTWYSAPYPSEYARLNVLYICEYCLKPIKSYDVYVMHMQKCTFYFPPGNEIYRNGDLSVFEVDGYVSKLYCQQLCLLAKLFLDHKTLYYDVEPFLFYVAVISKNKSSHIIGYFSKEKRSTHKYNLSCIMVLPPYQKYNYGRFLIDFSYLLSRKEGQCGSPEKPLSILGRISYESYWKSKILPYILNKDDVTVDFYARQKIYKPSKGLAVTIDRVSTETGISPHDVASTIQLLSKKVDLDNSDRISIQFDWEKLKSEAEKYASRYPKWIPIDEECLRWVPLINPNEKCLNVMRSQPQTVSPQRDFSSISEVDKIKQKKSVVESNKNPTALKSNSVSEEISDKTFSKINENKSELLKPMKKKRESGTNNKSTQSAIKNKSINKSKSLNSEKIEMPQSKTFKKKEVEIKRDLIVTRNFSNRRSNSTSSNHDEISPLKVDLTKEASEASDIQEADDCIEISSSIPPKRKTDIRTNKKPLFEQFKETVAPAVSGLTLSPPKESPPINRNDPSPVSMVHNEIEGPVLLSPEIDEENEEESDLGPIINDKRRLILILEKCDEKNVSNDSPCRETIDLSDDFVSISEKDCEIVEKKDRNVFLAMEDKRIEEMEVVISRDSPTESNPIILSNSEDSSTSTNSEWFSVASKIDEFLLPAATAVKEPNTECEKPPPILSRISSQEDCVSNTVDDSSTSFNLPADISQNEEFKNFYNNGNVFNSITNSQTDSSEKDADESLLSVSNSNSFGISDFELNGAYSCDSSICYNLRPRLRSLKLEEEFFDTSNNNNKSNSFRCSPGQSDIRHNHVSSTTPFVSPSVVVDRIATGSEVDVSIGGGGDGGDGSIDGGLKHDDVITFEDIEYVNDVDGMRSDQLLLCGGEDECKIDGNSDSNGGSNGDWRDCERSKQVEHIKKIELAKDSEAVEMNNIHMDIVSSSFNENGAVSDSSL